MRRRALVAAPPLNGQGEAGPGKPGKPRRKRDPKIIAAILDHLRLGAPIVLSTAACGISADSFANWRRESPELQAEVEKAISQGAVAKLRKIEALGKENFQAMAWLLERRFPEHFSRPEVHFSIGIQNNVSAASNGHLDFASVVVSDIEFATLKAHGESYEHHRTEQPANAFVVGSVPEELSGCLVKQGHDGGSVISERQYAETRRRVSRAEERVESLLAAKLKGQPGPVTMTPEVGGEADVQVGGIVHADDKAHLDDHEVGEFYPGAFPDQSAARRAERSMVGTIGERRSQPTDRQRRGYFCDSLYCWGQSAGRVRGWSS